MAALAEEGATPAMIVKALGMFSTAPAKRRETLHQMATLVQKGSQAAWKDFTGQLLVVVLEVRQSCDLCDAALRAWESAPSMDVTIPSLASTP